MTNDEARRIIIKERLESIADCAYFGECKDLDCWECGDNVAYVMALDALKNNEKPKLETVRTAEWKHDTLCNTNGGTYDVWRCSNCGTTFQYLMADNYCGECGAYMKGGNNG